jgi:hypothetical protein
MMTISLMGKPGRKSHRDVCGNIKNIYFQQHER